MFHVKQFEMALKAHLLLADGVAIRFKNAHVLTCTLRV